MKALFPIVLLILFQAQLFAANGDDSLHAIPAKEGMNITPRTPCWFSYTLTEPDKKLIISSDGYTSENTCLIVYDSCNGNIIAQNDDYNYTSYSYSHYSNQSYVAISGLAPTTIYIYWGDEHSTMYLNWELRIEDDIELINCRNAVAAAEGSNEFPLTNTWFYFTMPSANKKLVVSSYCTPTTEDFGLFFYHSCDSDYFDQASYCDLGNGKEIFMLDSNETVYFHWLGTCIDSYQFNLSVEDIKPGDISSLSLPAVEGTHEMIVEDQIWYSFTMPKDDQKLILSWRGYAYPKLYNEELKEIIGTDQTRCFKCPQCRVYNEIDSGATLYIQLARYNDCYSSGYLIWTLSVGDIQPGDFCSSPIKAVEGTYDLDGGFYWYSYTMDESDKKIVLDSVKSIPGDANPGPACGMNVFDACNGNRIPLYWFNNKYYIADLEPGQTIYLKFGCVYYWKLELEDRVTGDRCSDPLTISEGVHNVPVTPTWYSFTMPEKNKQLVISAPYINNNAASIEVFDSCGGTFLNKEQSLLDTISISRFSGIDSGQTVIIRWRYPKNDNNFSWSLSLGDYPDIVAPAEINITLDKGETGSCDIAIGNQGGCDLHTTLTPESSARMDYFFSNRIIIPDTAILSPENAVSISLWLFLSSYYDSVDCDATDNWRLILAKGLAFMINEGYDIILEEDRTLTWDVGTMGGLMRYRSENVLPYDQWAHLTFTYDAIDNKAAIYMNGAEISGVYLSNGSGSIVGNTADLILNHKYNTSEYCGEGLGHFLGRYDELSIWNIIRISDDIKEDLVRPLTGIEEGLIGYWGFENGKYNQYGDEIVEDYSPNHIDGHGNFSLSDSPFSFFKISPRSLTITPGSSGIINMLFEPGERDHGIYTAKLAIHSDDPDNSFLVVPVKMRITDLLTIRGYVRTPAGNGIRGVTLSGLPGNPVTDSRGYYSIVVDTGWSGTVTLIHEAYDFEPSYYSYSNVTNDQLTDYTGIIHTFEISGYVRTSGGEGIGNVVLSGLPGNPQTDSNGHYSAMVDYGWCGEVTPVHEAYTFTPSGHSFSNVISNQEFDYTAFIRTYSISGNIWKNGSEGISGVIMSGLPVNPITDSAGHYSGTVNYGWSGTVTPVHPAYTFNPTSATYSNVTSDHFNSYDAYLRTYSVSGYIRTEEGAGVGGILLSGLPGSPVTGSDGFYSTTVDYGWSDTVTPVHEIFTFEPEYRLYDSVTSTQASDYTVIIPTYTISGYIRTNEGEGISDVLLSGLPGNPVTDTDGHYSATVDYGWSGAVTPLHEGYSFNPSNIFYNDVNLDQLTYYTGTIHSYVISGYVRTEWGEGVTGVTLSGLPGNPVTNDDGYYSDIVDYGWSGTFTPVHEAYTFTPFSTSFNNINNVQECDFTAILKTYTINGFILTNGYDGVQGVVLSGLPGDPVTTNNGYFSATVEYGWNGTVTPVHEQYSFEPPFREYENITADQNDIYVGTSYTAIPDYEDNLLGLTVYPNPFNDNTTFSYYLPETAEVQLIVYDIRGMIIQTLVNDRHEAGSYKFTWDGSGAENGIYYYKLCFTSALTYNIRTIYGKLTIIGK